MSVDAVPAELLDAGPRLQLRGSGQRVANVSAAFARVWLGLPAKGNLAGHFCSKYYIVPILGRNFICLMLQRKAGRFYPTRLALNITSKNAVTSVGSDDECQQDKGHIVVETNYRVTHRRSTRIRDQHNIDICYM